MPARIAIIGGGPIGIEAALAATECGFDARLYERGKIGEAVRTWGHVRMFSPFGMNCSEAGIARLKARAVRVPPPEALLTGCEYVESYLRPLSETLPVQAGTEVRAIGRTGLTKSEKIGAPDRSATPFRLLLRSVGREWTEAADVVLDCTGTFSTPNYVGDGGIPSPGESACRDAIRYGIADIRSSGEFRGRRTLVVGAGHSAATAICDLADVKAEAAGTEIVWAVRKADTLPCRLVEGDALPARAALVQRANAIAGTTRVDYRPGRVVESLARRRGRIQVTLRAGDASEKIVVDAIIAAVGFRPDLSLARELQVQTCWATEGTYPLAAALLGAAGGDCLSVPAFGVDTLRHPEPGYFALGMKSYGRTPDFLIRTGREQIASVLDWLQQAGR